MSDTYMFGAYWGARQESRDACIVRLLEFLPALASCHEFFARWNDKGWSDRDAKARTILPTRESLERYVHPTEPEDPITLGYDFSAWNGRDPEEEQLSLWVSCGGAIFNSGLWNHVVIEPPDPSNANESLYQADVLVGIFRAIIESWTPDHAVLMSYEYRETYITDDNTQLTDAPLVGWMTYLRHTRLGGVTDPPPCEAIEIPDRGTLFIVTREHRFSVDNSDDVARAQELTAFLEARGALELIPSSVPC